MRKFSSGFAVTSKSTLKMKFPISDILEVLFLKNCKYSGVSTINLSWMNFGQNMFLLNCQERICMRKEYVLYLL